MTKEVRKEMAKAPRLGQTTPKMSMRGGLDGAQGHSADVFGTNDFSTGPRARHGDLLPLPLPMDQGFTGRLCELGSRRAQQRVSLRRRLLGGVRDTVRALNTLAGFTNEDHWPVSVRNLAQAESLRRIRQSHEQRPPPILKETGQEALRQLLKHKGGSGYSIPEGPGQLASFVKERLSLPRDQQTPTPLADILPEKEKLRLADFETEMMLSSEEMAGVLEQGFHGDCFLDPQLSCNPRKYHEFIGDLYTSKLIGFTVNPRVQVGAFVVTKKGNKQRLIIDARRTNKLFRTPPTTVLGSLDAWGRLEVCDGSSNLFMAQEDVKDFFYRLGIGKKLGEFFCLPKVDGKKLKEVLGYLPDEFVSLSDQHSADIYPHLAVLPMGFSWAFHLAHESHCFLARQTLPGVPLLLDRHPAPQLGKGEGHAETGMLIYADNNNHFGLDQQKVHAEQEMMMRSLHSHGLDTHDIVESTTICESLGVRINGLSGDIQPTPHRDWRLERLCGHSPLAHAFRESSCRWSLVISQYVVCLTVVSCVFFVMPMSLLSRVTLRNRGFGEVWQQRWNWLGRFCL